ncbi:MAG: hypothetical protein IVW53_15000 [Chloroflexi bacterium]|nr:hypothetical protein [Chloroflexota bacterium]
MSDVAPLYPVSRRHLEALTDSIGIMQHAVGRRPSPEHGYCTDDVCRSLTVDLLHRRELGWAAVSASAWRSQRFLADAFEVSTGRFRNFRAVDGTWLDSPGSEDAHARAVLALAEAMLEAPDEAFRHAVTSLFHRALPATLRLRALRPRASALLACDAALRAGGTGDIAPTYRRLATSLRAEFEGPTVTVRWPWPEAVLTYENGLVARALISGGEFLDAPDMVRLGGQVLDWLIEAQTASDGHLTTVGNRGWWPRDGVRARFDQQPIEATALLLAAEIAWEATHEDRYRRAAEAAYAWFLGGNDLGLAIADPQGGGCRDGLTPVGMNHNEGAESTLMWLIALEHMRAMRGRFTLEAASPGLVAVSVTGA